MAIIQESILKTSTTLNALSEVLLWFEGLHRSAIAKKIWLRCQLALAEAFTNAVRHAHKNQSSEVPIEIKVTILKDRLEIRIWDYGQPFDLEKKLKEMPSNEDNDTGGGRGLQLMKSLVDRLSYTRQEDGRNCLLMVKHYTGDNGSIQRNMVDFS
ncbi:MAG TPA: anti-sigma regulatory factor [Leptolyngbyaceae cyanobacterium]